MNSEWRNLLIMNSSGTGLAPRSSQNAYLLLKHQADFEGMFIMDDGLVKFTRTPSWPRRSVDSLQEVDITAMQGLLEYSGLDISYAQLLKIVTRIAYEAAVKDEE